MTARSPQATPNPKAYFAAAPASMTPGRSLLGKSSGRSKAPAAAITARARIFHNLVCALESLSSEGAADLPECVLRERLWKIRARAVIAAAGAFERPLLFPNNDRPGVMLAGAAAKYASGFGVACGERAVIAANSDSAYEVGALLAALGIEIAAIVDRREGAAPIAGAAGLRVMTGAVLRAVHGARSVRGCTVASLEGGRRERIHCDLVLNAGGRSEEHTSELQ